jgi:hypothetical protein
MKLKHNTTTAFSIAGVTAMLVAAAVWATPQPKAPMHAGCPGKALATEAAGGGSSSPSRAAP